MENRDGVYAKTMIFSVYLTEFQLFTQTTLSLCNPFKANYVIYLNAVSIHYETPDFNV